MSNLTTTSACSLALDCINASFAILRAQLALALAIAFVTSKTSMSSLLSSLMNVVCLSFQLTRGCGIFQGFSILLIKSFRQEGGVDISRGVLVNQLSLVILLVVVVRHKLRRQVGRAGILSRGLIGNLEAAKRLRSGIEVILTIVSMWLIPRLPIAFATLPTNIRSSGFSFMDSAVLSNELITHLVNFHLALKRSADEQLVVSMNARCSQDLFGQNCIW